MIAGAGTLEQCEEGMAELAKSGTPSEDVQEGENDEVTIRQSPSGSPTKTKSKAVMKNKQSSKMVQQPG